MTPASKFLLPFYMQIFELVWKNIDIQIIYQEMCCPVSLYSTLSKFLLIDCSALKYFKTQTCQHTSDLKDLFSTFTKIRPPQASPIVKHENELPLLGS